MALFFLLIFITVVIIVVVICATPNSHEEVQNELSAKYVSDDDVLTNAVGLLAKAEALRQAEIMGDEKTRAAILNDTYKGQWPERRGDDGWLSIYDDLRILNVAGMSFRQGMSRYKGFIDAALVPEPNNEFDQNAIKIVAIDRHHLGYIPADQTDFVRSLTGESFPYRCKCEVIEGYNDDDEKTYHGFVYIRRKDKGE
jgi:hypothetical protein